MPALLPDAERFRALEQDTRLLTRAGTDLFANRYGVDISCSAFLADVLLCAEQLPQARHCINLCADRYRFTTAFFAAALRSQTTLLPSQRNSDAIHSLRNNYTSCTVLADSADTDCDALIDLAPGANGSTDQSAKPLVIDPGQVCAIAFTSGSTGTPQPHAKSWGQLIAGRATHARYLTGAVRSGNQPSQPNRGLVATVPSWHMYGLEWAMLLPTVASYTLHCGADFFPGDVRDAIERFERDTVLVSTPVHLRALLKTPAPSNTIAAAVCATAPLDNALTTATEKHLNSCMFEIYGCSEIGSLAWRQPAKEVGWEFFDTFGVHLADPVASGILHVTTEHLPDPVTLADRFGKLAGTRYELLGRSSDLVKVAGKRQSLANLNSILLAMPNVDDGVIYQPSMLAQELATGQEGGERLAAFVVGKNLDVGELRQALAARLDPAFVPRPIRKVDALPRDTTSKLKVAALTELAKSYLAKSYLNG